MSDCLNLEIERAESRELPPPAPIRRRRLYSRPRDRERSRIPACGTISNGSTRLGPYKQALKKLHSLATKTISFIQP